MKASDHFVKCLENEGVEYLFGIPGEENLDMLNSLVGSSVKLVLTRHEQAAGFMAATYGRLTGKPGVCWSTLGPGATNLVTPAAYAQLGAMPMVMITGQKPIKTSKQGHFQIVDIVGMMDPLTKFTRSIESGDRVAADVREAFRLAQEERPGATHLELAEDIARENTSSVPIPVHGNPRRPVAEEKAIRKALEMIAKAKRPLLLVGAGANRKLTCKSLRDFIEKTQIPFFTTQMGKGVLSEDHPLSLGCAALSSGDFVHRAIQDSDLVINVGHDVVEKPPFLMQVGGKQVIHINFVSAVVDPVYFPQLEIIGDIANAIWQLKEGFQGTPSWDFPMAAKAREAFLEHTDRRADCETFPVVPERLVNDLRDVMPRDGIIALDNGVYKIWFARNYKAYQPNTVLLDNALATMGAGLPSAMAAHLVHPERKVVAICGDGGFMMNSAELETAVRLKMNIVVLILRDDAYGMIKWKQANMGFEEYGLNFGNPDFVAYAESYGANGHRIESTESLRATLQHCLDTPGVHLIDLPVDYSQNDHILNQQIQQESAAL